MITKRKRLEEVSVKFSWESTEPVYLAGTFNNWEPALMSAGAGDIASLVVKVPLGTRIEFRYVNADGGWFDDPEAEEYVWNEHGTTNGVVHT